MAINDKLFAWFIRNVVISKTEIIDKPGFAISQFSISKEVGLREIFIPEIFIQNFEKKTETHKNLIYSVGKFFWLQLQ
jgi:hypothetical protein